ncbi:MULTISPECIES: YceI family protein [Pseudoalteromonas]|uniref:YceI family protein n=1 Tax=Pseudoalteromonas obscura TaxID=3048491 RepID=A0ABT7EQ13_9GAMM|nr:MULTISPECIES: YceI family protein [Pseudoalteromonas]MBQ4839443.1 YceI family protein [Pseudoalteromonas luteoviolacea]MDK2597117.1 YceI family protein [Pseudoalteromonas sp. P94(2023)]
MLKPLLIGSLCFMSQAVSAWQLNNELSDLSFTSIKLNSIAENHHFTSLSGQISDTGKLNIAIDLSSIESLIPIRNERMKKVLFEVSEYKTATIETNLTPWLPQLKEGMQIIKALPVTLNLHGKNLVLKLDLVINKLGKTMHVSPQRAVLINSRDFDLEGGVEALRKLAGLNHISQAVPVTFNLVFNDQ